MSAHQAGHAPRVTTQRTTARGGNPTPRVKAVTARLTTTTTLNNVPPLRARALPAPSWGEVSEGGRSPPPRNSATEVGFNDTLVALDDPRCAFGNLLAIVQHEDR